MKHTLTMQNQTTRIPHDAYNAKSNNQIYQTARIPNIQRMQNQTVDTESQAIFFLGFLPKALPPIIIRILRFR